MVFALLLAATIVLLRPGIPEGGDAAGAEGFTDSTRRDAALALIPFAGIFFLWFLGVVRAPVGDAEDRFLAAVLLGSGPVFTATLFGAAASATAVPAVAHPAGSAPSPTTWDFGRHFAYTLLTDCAMRMAAVFVSSMSVIGTRMGVLPRWLTAVGAVTALLLLFVPSHVPWAELLFSAWSLLLSAHILPAGGRRRRVTPP